MPDFDRAKEAINLSKHGISLARWIDLEVREIARDDRFEYGEPRFRAYGISTASPTAWFSRSAENGVALSACGVPTQRR